MKTGTQRKTGFTLVELMVVAIIVAILASVAIPLMSGNTNRAMATEGQTGCSTIATQLRAYKSEHGTFDVNGSGSAVATDLPGVTGTDFDGKFFKTANYVLSDLSVNTYTITATAAAGDATGMKVTLNETGGWDDTGSAAGKEWL